jgi:hypothetical protein
MYARGPDEGKIKVESTRKQGTSPITQYQSELNQGATEQELGLRPEVDDVRITLASCPCDYSIDLLAHESPSSLYIVESRLTRKEP